MKCINCGHEFDGKFCPECGTPAVEYLPKCPNCGKDRHGEEKFCTDCGYSFLPLSYAKKIEPVKTGGGLAAFYGILPSIPIYAFAVLSVFMFLIFLAPVTSIIININVYMLVGDVPAIIALIVLAVISFLFAVYAICTLFVPKLKVKSFTLGKNTFTLNDLNTVISCILLLVYFIASCVICGILSSNLLSIGACPVLIMVFSLLLIFIAAGTFVARYLIGKNFPEIKKDAEKKFLMQNEAYLISVRKQQAEFVAKGEPAAPETVDKPLKPQLNETEITVAKYERFKIRSLCYFCLPTFLLGILSSVISCFFRNYKPSRWDAESKIKGKGMRIIFLLGIIFMVAALALCAITIFVGYTNCKEAFDIFFESNGKDIPDEVFQYYLLFGEDFYVTDIFSYLKYFAIFAVNAPSLIINMNNYEFIPFSFIFWEIYVFALLAIYQIIWLIAVRSRTKSYRKKLNKTFYGTTKPKRDTMPVCQYSDFNKEYLEKLYAYKMYKRKQKNYIHNKRKYDRYVNNLNAVSAANANTYNNEKT